MLNKNLAKHYYVSNNRLQMQLYCHFNFFCLSLKTKIKCTFSSERAFKFHLAQRMRMVAWSVDYWHKTVLRKCSKKHVLSSHG